MMKLVWIGLGGGVGSVARYLIDGWVQAAAGGSFPFGTLVVNAVGCFLLGLIAHVSLATELVQPTLRLALTTGLLGGFTTYSAFNHQTLGFLRSGAWALGGANVLATWIACMAAGALGLAAGRWAVGA